MTVRSLQYDQHAILRDIADLHCDGRIEADLTYGNGGFWKGQPKHMQPIHRFDIAPQTDDCEQACSTDLPLSDGKLSSAVFDPPFLTYIRPAKRGTGSSVMAKRFSGYWRYDELEQHYCDTLTECARVLAPRGVLVFKCQDIIHNHRMHCTHANVITWAAVRGFRLTDLFVLGAKHRMPMPNRKAKQRHARVFHSYFLVLTKVMAL